MVTYSQQKISGIRPDFKKICLLGNFAFKNITSHTYSFHFKSIDPNMIDFNVDLFQKTYLQVNQMILVSITIMKCIYKCEQAMFKKHLFCRGARMHIRLAVISFAIRKQEHRISSNPGIMETTALVKIGCNCMQRPLYIPTRPLANQSASWLNMFPECSLFTALYLLPNNNGKKETDNVDVPSFSSINFYLMTHSPSST